MHTRPILVLALAAAALSACGDNPPDDTPTPPTQSIGEVPASAYASTATYSNYAGTLPPSDSAEPLKLGLAAAPTSETEEPVPVQK